MFEWRAFLPKTVLWGTGWELDLPQRAEYHRRACFSPGALGQRCNQGESCSEVEQKRTDKGRTEQAKDKEEFEMQQRDAARLSGPSFLHQ